MAAAQMQRMLIYHKLRCRPGQLEDKGDRKEIKQGEQICSREEEGARKEEQVKVDIFA